jgi:hypothetical protein
VSQSKIKLAHDKKIYKDYYDHVNPQTCQARTSSKQRRFKWLNNTIASHMYVLMYTFIEIMYNFVQPFQNTLSIHSNYRV